MWLFYFGSHRDHKIFCLVAFIILILVLLVRFALVGALVLGGLVDIGLLVVQVGEDEIEDLVVPACRSPLDSFFDVLLLWLASNITNYILCSDIPLGVLTSQTCCPPGR